MTLSYILNKKQRWSDFNGPVTTGVNDDPSANHGVRTTSDLSHGRTRSIQRVGRTRISGPTPPERKRQVPPSVRPRASLPRPQLLRRPRRPRPASHSLVSAAGRRHPSSPRAPGRRRRHHRFPPQSHPDATRNGFSQRILLLLLPPWRRRPRRPLTRTLIPGPPRPRPRPFPSPCRARVTTSTTTWSIAGTRRGAARVSRSGAGAGRRWKWRRQPSWCPARPGTSSRTCRTCRTTSPISR